jgi:hypothetical protein
MKLPRYRRIWEEAWSKFNSAVHGMIDYRQKYSILSLKFLFSGPDFPMGD